MSDKTSIAWCDATFNPWIGCTKVSPGCANCYAEVNSASRVFGVKWGKGQARQRTIEGNWRKPLAWNMRPERLVWPYPLTPALSPEGREGVRRPRVFCASLADWLDEEVPIAWLVDLLKLIHDTPNLDWLLLTKRPENYDKRVVSFAQQFLRLEEHGDYTAIGRSFAEWLSWWLAGKPPSNLWFGVSVEDQKRAEERIPQLLKIPARVRFLSVEPLLGLVDLGPYLAGRPKPPLPIANSQWPRIDWVIVGGESGPKARPCNVEWVRDIVGQCRAAGVPCFVKQLGSLLDIDDCKDPFGNTVMGDDERWYTRLTHPKGGDPSEWPEDLRVREFPMTNEQNV